MNKMAVNVEQGIARVSLEDDVTNKLAQVAPKFEGTMFGVEYRFKGKGSMVRKIKSDIKEFEAPFSPIP